MWVVSQVIKSKRLGIKNIGITFSRSAKKWMIINCYSWIRNVGWLGAKIGDW